MAPKGGNAKKESGRSKKAENEAKKQEQNAAKKVTYSTLSLLSYFGSLTLKHTGTR
jgi:hypothetical protein